MDAWLLYPLLVVAIGTGWWLGRREKTTTHEGVSANYYHGLKHLLNDEPDRAVTSFIRDLEVTKDTLETHLALGGVLRRKGDLEQAVIVHQNILHGSLDPETLLSVKLELARDYLLAGLLDRAESLSLELADAGGSVGRESLRIMLEIYEREKEWRQAVEVASQLASGEDTEKYERAISHYYCELAEEALSRGEPDNARELISEAIGHDNHNPRASLIQGQIDIRQGRFADAIRVLQRVKDQNALYVPESLEALKTAYDGQGESLEPLVAYLNECLTETPSISVVLMLANVIRESSGDEAVARFIADHLKQNPTVRGLTQLIDLHIDNTSGVARENLSILRSFAEALVADKPAYRCESCGLEGKKMRWHCPGCKDWASIKPIFGLEGE